MYRNAKRARLFEGDVQLSLLRGLCALRRLGQGQLVAEHLVRPPRFALRPIGSICRPPERVSLLRLSYCRVSCGSGVQPARIGVLDCRRRARHRFLHRRVRLRELACRALEARGAFHQARSLELQRLRLVLVQNPLSLQREQLRGPCLYVLLRSDPLRDALLHIFEPRQLTLQLSRGGLRGRWGGQHRLPSAARAGTFCCLHKPLFDATGGPRELARQRCRLTRLPVGRQSPLDSDTFVCFQPNS